MNDAMDDSDDEADFSKMDLVRKLISMTWLYWSLGRFKGHGTVMVTDNQLRIIVLLAWDPLNSTVPQKC